MANPETWVFGDRDDLIRHLKERDWKRDFQEQVTSPQLGPLIAIYHSVGRSTFRAFRKYKDWQPSVVFREWAARQLVEGRMSELMSVRSVAEYERWVFKMSGSLGKEWRKRLHYSLDIGRSLKLINLLAKGLCLAVPLWPEDYKAIVPYIEVPLDKYSLRPLACVPELQDLGINWVSATMGSIKGKQSYLKIQESIRRFCSDAGVPPLAYDFLAWDVPHEPVSKRKSAGA